jgi:hypothetical protein
MICRLYDDRRIVGQIAIDALLTLSRRCTWPACASFRRSSRSTSRREPKRCMHWLLVRPLPCWPLASGRLYSSLGARGFLVMALLCQRFCRWRGGCALFIARDSST